MIALLVKEDKAKETLAELTVLGDVVRVQKMSELTRAFEQGTLEWILVDERMGIQEAVQTKFPQVVVTSILPPGDVFVLLAKQEQLDSRVKNDAANEANEWIEWTEAVEEGELAVSDTWVNAPSTPLRNGQESPREVLRRTEEALVSNRLMPAMPEPPQAPAFFRRRGTPLIMLEGPKGGAGRSTVGAHMALYAALHGKRVAIVDLDVNGDISEKFGFLQSADVRGWRGGDMAAAVADGICHVHETGVHLIPSPQSRDIVLFDPDDALYLVQLAMSEMDLVFVDMPQGWTPLHRLLLPLVSEVVMAVRTLPDSLGRVEEHAEKLVMAKVEPDKVSVVVNQARKRSELKIVQPLLTPYQPRVLVPYDRKLEKLGGLHGKKLSLACKDWWDSSLGFQKSVKKGRWKR